MDTDSDSLEFSLFNGPDSPREHVSENRVAEIKINLRKFRSIRISRLPTLRSFRRREMLQCDELADAKSIDSSSYEQCTTTEMSDASSNNMKGITGYEEKKDATQESKKALTRRSSLKSRKPLMSKTSGETGMRRKLKKLNSIKLINLQNLGRAGSQDDEASSSVKSASSFEGNNLHLQASLSETASSFSSTSQQTLGLHTSSTSSTDHKTAKMLSKSSIKAMTKLTQVAGTKSKRSSLVKTPTPELLDTSIVRATCSSTLKSSKLPNNLKLEAGENNCEGLSAGKVCKYSYCSLHGNHNTKARALKRYSSIRRQRQKTQKSRKPAGGSLTSDNIQTRREASKGGDEVQETIGANRITSKLEAEKASGSSVRIYAMPKAQTREIGIQTEDRGFSDDDNSAQNSQQNSDLIRGELHIIVKSPELVETNMERYHVGMKVNDERTEPTDASRVLETKTSVGIATCQGQDTEDSRGSKDIASEVSSAFVWNPLDEYPTSNGEKHRHIKSEHEYEQHRPPLEVSALDMEWGKQKRKNLWNLIYEQMTSELSTADRTNQNPHGSEVVKDKVGEHSPTLLGTDDTVSSQIDSEASQDTGMENQDAGIQNIEFSESDAIKLVQEAINNMLSKFHDHSSDDHPITSERAADHNIQQQNQAICEEPSISFSTISLKESSSDSIKTPSKGGMPDEMEKIPNRRLSNNWSNLKRFVLLRRVVKTLERMKSFSPQKQYLPLDPSTAAEKTHLKHQTTEDRRGAEEWMLDYALQQVIYKLAPAQQRRVSLLVEAFESLSLQQGKKTHQKTNVVAFSNQSDVQACNDLALHRGESSEVDMLQHVTSGILERKTSTEGATCQDQDIEDCTGSKVVTNEVSSASVWNHLDEYTTANGEKVRGNMLERDYSQGHSSFVVAEPNSTNDKTLHVEWGQKKRKSLWNLIYRQMTYQLPRTDETNLNLHGKAIEDKHNEHSIALLGTDDTSSSLGDSEADEDTAMENQDAHMQSIEFNESDAINLVQEAINNMLSKCQDHSSDHHPITSKMAPDQNLQEKNQAMSEKPSISTSAIVKESSSDSINTSREDRIPDKMEKIPNQRPSANWSNLKRYVLLRRFVKTLERMKSFSPRKRYLPSDPSTQAEKICLRHQKTEARRNAEEWMLDHALQQVISKLAPAQQRRVSQLVEAFESLTPSQENGTHQTTYLGAFLVEGNVQARSEPEVNTGKQEQSGKENSEGVRDTETSVKHDVSKHAFYEEIPGRERAFQVAQEYTTDITSVTVEADTNGEAKPENKSLQGFPPPKISQGNDNNTVDVADGAQSKQKKHTNLWFSVYKHMVSGIPKEKGAEKFLDDAVKEKRVDRPKMFHGVQSLHQNQELDMTDENKGAGINNGGQTMESCPSEAIKLIEQAIDEIVLTDNEDQLSDNQSTTSNISSDQELLDEKQNEEEYLNSASINSHGVKPKETSKVNLESSSMSYSEESLLKCTRDALQKEDKPVSMMGKKISKNKSSRWSYMKKMILLDKFFKTLDRIRELNLQGGKHLLSEADPEKESVKLKHQEMGDRKSDREWMLDYAMQQVVGKLTPARKRKVQLLVEAFETVIAPVGTETS